MRSILVGAIALALFASGIACGGDDNDAGDVPSNPAAQETASSPGNQPTESARSGDAGTLTLEDEVIALDEARCFLQEQDVAGSAGKILFQAQGMGTTADGEEFVLDVSRYDEDSLFTGDDIQVDVGDPRGEAFYSWDASADLGTIELGGSSLRAGGLTFQHSEDGSEVMGAFELNC